MYCPEDGTHIEPPEEIDTGYELVYPSCPNCGAKWVYQPDLTIGPCYILDGWDEGAQVRWMEAQIQPVENPSSEQPS